ncbi:Glu/Leu/Phe/Val family dehydrogenase [Sphingomonas sp. NFX23]|uniref:Glu/Leu/Phe/Val family dehydrogenase n=1 Tax=Sphingomonas sp. NFX23 TaxID=2819532 RepID=UPI003CF95813
MTNFLPPEHSVRLDDPQSGLQGFIVIHSTALGPAAGGCRFWHYATHAEASYDAVRLATGMSLKNALAGLPLGGGKAVIMRPEKGFDRRALFSAFGRAVADLGGSYVTAEDVGTGLNDMACVSERTSHVAGLPQRPNVPGGDPSPWTAYGVFQAMRVAVRRQLGRDLSEVSVAVQGTGNVGMELCRLLHGAGARLVISEPRSEVAARASVLYSAQVLSSDAILSAPVDVFAPCALGGVLTLDMLPRMKARVVCGAANNQLATAEVGDRLADLGVLYAPDYLVNAGGIINVAAEYLNWRLDDVSQKVDAIPTRLSQVLTLAEAQGIGSHRAADAMAMKIITDAPRMVSPQSAAA